MEKRKSNMVLDGDFSKIANQHSAASGGTAVFWARLQAVVKLRRLRTERRPPAAAAND
jgi:hypothetical protein